MTRGFDRLFAVLDERGPADPWRACTAIYGAALNGDATGCGLPCIDPGRVTVATARSTLAMMRSSAASDTTCSPRTKKRGRFPLATRTACRSISSTFLWFTSIFSVGRMFAQAERALLAVA